MAGLVHRGVRPPPSQPPQTRTQELLEERRACAEAVQRLEATHAETLAAKDAALGIAQRQLAALREEADALQRRRTADLEARAMCSWVGGWVDCRRRSRRRPRCTFRGRACPSVPAPGGVKQAPRQGSPRKPPAPAVPGWQGWTADVSTLRQRLAGLEGALRRASVLERMADDERRDAVLVKHER